MGSDKGDGLPWLGLVCELASIVMQWTLLLCLALASSVAQASRIELTPESDWFSVLNGERLQPGDEVVLGKGTYSDARLLSISHVGTAEKPITIRGKASEGVIFHRPDDKQNSINIVGAQYLILKDIEITGGSAGVRISKKQDRPAKFILIEGFHVHHIGGVAFTANHVGNEYEGLVFRGNHVHHTGGHGEAFYLGSNNAEDGSTTGRVFHSLIEWNYIHHLNGDNVSQGDGIELKDGSFGNVIRHNVIHDTKYPGIIVYGTDGQKRNVIEANVIWNSGDHGIQAAADVLIRNNVIFDCKGDGIHVREHQSAKPMNVAVIHNTVSCPGRAIRIVASGAPVAMAANNYFMGGIELPGGAVSDLCNHRARYVEGRKDFVPKPGSGAAVEFADRRFRVAEDFNGTPRTAGVGAYEPAAVNPGWIIQAGFKPRAK